jgi:hypothetical protein
MKSRYDCVAGTLKAPLDFTVWFTGWLLAVVGGESLGFGANFAASTATNAVSAEHLAQLKVPEDFTVVAQPPFVVFGADAAGEVLLDLFRTA